MRDAAGERWLEFSRPRRFVITSALAEVAASLEKVEAAVAGGNVHAAGFVSYEAAPAFDAALTVRSGGEFPLLWFGLFERVDEIHLPTPAAAAPAEADWQPSVTLNDYFAALDRVKALIRSGETYQVNYTFRLRGGAGSEAATRENASAPMAAAAVQAPDPWGFFLRLAAGQESACSAFIDAGRWVICSASPELFFRLNGERIESRPMKGTAARGLTPAQDRAQANALRTSGKDLAENVMIVDMVRHDLGRVAEPGSVNVSSLFEVEKYPTLWQMTSTIQARTRAGLREIFGALFPPASVTGAPKVRTMQLISELETSPRLLYTGAIGFVTPGRRAQFNVAIRTLLVDRQTGHAEYGVGSGIVWDSQPDQEWRECLTKARVLAAPVPEFSLLETTLWTPEAGYFLLERHLQRLGESAGYFAFRLNLPAVRAKLADLSLSLPRSRHKIRLLLAKDGSVTVSATALPEASANPRRIALAAAPVDSSYPLLYHKTTHRALYEAALNARAGYDDLLLFNERGEVTESTIANVVVELGGKRVTPPVECGLLAGTFRADLLARREVTERAVTMEELLRSPRVFLINSVRGMYQVEVCEAREKPLRAPNRVSAPPASSSPHPFPPQSARLAE
jgi:para-aminobenzoate synthetase/4-amino-4-deoxychorismate lyase